VLRHATCNLRIRSVTELGAMSS